MADLILGIGSRVKHTQYGEGVVIQVWPDVYDIVFLGKGTEQISHGDDVLEVVEFVGDSPDQVSFAKMQTELIKILRKFSDIQETSPIADKWKGGKIIIEPADTSLQSKEIPIDTFFHKIVMVRDRM